MSASNWAICPRCLEKAEMVAKEERERVMDTYGRVSVEYFDKCRAALKSVDPEEYQTFREDYEFYGVEDGVITAHYKGWCSTCGVGVSFDFDSERFWTPES